MTAGDEATPAAAAATPAGPRNTHFDFQAKVFQAPGACFMLKGKEKDPMFGVDCASSEHLRQMRA